MPDPRLVAPRAGRSRLAVIFVTVLIDLIGFSAMQFLSTALLGRLSDRVGRRPILLTTMLINAAGYTLFAFAPSYALLFVARVISGFASGNISAAQAYVADITSPVERARGMGVIG